MWTIVFLKVILKWNRGNEKDFKFTVVFSIQNWNFSYLITFRLPTIGIINRQQHLGLLTSSQSKHWSSTGFHWLYYEVLSRYLSAHLRVTPVLKLNRLVWVLSLLKNLRFLSYRWYRHRTYRLLYIVNECTVRLRAALQCRSKSLGHTIVKNRV